MVMKNSGMNNVSGTTHPVIKRAWDGQRRQRQDRAREHHGFAGDAIADAAGDERLPEKKPTGNSRK